VEGRDCPREDTEIAIAVGTVGDDVPGIPGDRCPPRPFEHKEVVPVTRRRILAGALSALLASGIPLRGGRTVAVTVGWTCLVTVLHDGRVLVDTFDDTGTGSAWAGVPVP
jgi:hypothetical protein